MFFHLVDSSLGKIDKESLSHQTMMELLISGITDHVEEILANLDDLSDISKWAGVELNSKKEVVIINWSVFDLKGTIDLQWLPSTVQHLFLPYNDLTGRLDLTDLPGRLRVLSLSYNRFFGTLDLTQLPNTLEELYLSANSFQGMTDFAQLPKTLKSLEVANTGLEGELPVDTILEVNTSNSKVMPVRSNSR